MNQNLIYLIDWSLRFDDFVIVIKLIAAEFCGTPKDFRHIHGFLASIRKLLLSWSHLVQR